jgi:hypothetical protein
VTRVSDEIEEQMSDGSFHAVIPLAYIRRKRGT